MAVRTSTAKKQGRNMKNKTWLLVVAFLCLNLTMAASASGEYVLIRDVLATAGGQASSASYLLDYSVGQTIVGASQGCSHTEWAGFWGGSPSGQPTFAAEEMQVTVPSKYLLHQNYPNPFNPQTHIAYRLPEANHVSLSIYNVRGQLVNRLVDQYQLPGEHEAIWNGQDVYGTPVASGVYFYRLTAGSFQQVRKMLLLK
jgi:hypothetical protein